MSLYTIQRSSVVSSEFAPSVVDSILSGYPALLLVVLLSFGYQLSIRSSFRGCSSPTVSYLWTSSNTKEAPSVPIKPNPLATLGILLLPQAKVQGDSGDSYPAKVVLRLSVVLLQRKKRCRHSTYPLLRAPFFRSVFAFGTVCFSGRISQQRTCEENGDRPRKKTDTHHCTWIVCMLPGLSHCLALKIPLGFCRSFSAAAQGTDCRLFGALSQ